MNLDERLREQAALYALDALPADEAAKFRELARRHPEIAELVAEFEAASALLAEDLPLVAPPAGLRARVLASATGRPEAPVAASRHPGPGVWIPWGIAAALAVTAAVLWNQNLRLDDQARNLIAETGRIPDLESQVTALRSAGRDKDQLAARLSEQVTELEQRRSRAELQVATLTSKLDASYLASIAWDNDAQEGVLKVRRLPATQRGKEYQLWVVDPNQPVPVSGGVFTVADDGSATIRFAPTQKVSTATAFAVSLEKAGGVPVREGPVVLSN